MPINRRTIITSAAALPLGMVPAFARPPDPVVTYVQNWFQAHQDWDIAAKKPGAENFDTPECLESEARMEHFAELICGAQPKTPEGIAAMIEYALEDWADYITGNVWKDQERRLFSNVISGARIINNPAL